MNRHLQRLHALVPRSACPTQGLWPKLPLNSLKISLIRILKKPLKTIKNGPKQFKNGTKQSNISLKPPNGGRARSARPPFGVFLLLFDCFAPFFNCCGSFLVVFSDFFRFLIKLILRLFIGSFGQRPLVGQAHHGAR